MSGGRSRRKKLVRSKRLSKTDSSEIEPNSQPPPLEVVTEDNAGSHCETEETDKSTEVLSTEDNTQNKLAAAASTWRAAADMGDSVKWRRVAVRALLDTNKPVNGTAGAVQEEELPTTPPPGPWGEKVTENAAVHVDMGKVVGVLRATHQLDQEENELNSAGEKSGFEIANVWLQFYEISIF